MKQVQFLAGRDSAWSHRFRQVRPAALCRGETAENRRLKGDEETKLGGVEEGQDEMSAEGGDRIDGDEDIGTARLAREGRAKKQTDTEGEKSTKRHTYRS